MNIYDKAHVLNNIPLNCRNYIILIFAILTVSLLKLCKKVQIQTTTENSIILVVTYNLIVTTVTLNNFIILKIF